MNTRMQDFKWLAVRAAGAVALTASFASVVYFLHL